MTDLQDDLERNFPSSDIAILGVNEHGQQSANDVITAKSDVPWLQDVDDNQNNVSDVWYDRWQITYRDVWLVDEANELASVFNLTSHDLANPANYNALRQMVVETATEGRVAESPWQNRIEPLDVNNDGFVVPNDVLQIITRLNTNGSGQLPVPSGSVISYFDATGDNHVTALDALRVIRHLNRFSLTGSGEPDVLVENMFPLEEHEIESVLAETDETPQAVQMLAEANYRVRALNAVSTPVSEDVDLVLASAFIDEVAFDEELPLTL